MHETLRDLPDIRPGIPIHPNGQSPAHSTEQAQSYDITPQSQSQPLIEDVIVTARAGIVKVWEATEPAPRRFVVEGLIPDGAVTTLYGDGGMGKSYIAQYLAMTSCLGLKLAGRQVEKRVCVYLD